MIQLSSRCDILFPNVQIPNYRSDYHYSWFQNSFNWRQNSWEKMLASSYQKAISGIFKLSRNWKLSNNRQS